MISGNEFSNGDKVNELNELEDQKKQPGAPDAVSAPAPGSIQWGDFRRTRPISDYWGLDRGRPVDRFYIEKFLSEFSRDLHGRCLEVENPGYSKRFGADRIERFDVLDIDETNPLATILADLSTGAGIPADAFDSFVLTQTLQYIYDVRGAVGSARRLLKSGGVVLATVPGITPIPVRDDASRVCCWSFTANSIQRIFGDEFGDSNVTVRTYGNVLSATSFLWGLSQEELTVEELERNDPDYQVTIAVRAKKPGGRT